MKQNKLHIIGLTGGIATGKTTVTNILKGVGIKVVDADKISRQILEPSKEGWYEIVAEFGNDFVKRDYTIDRKKLADYIFEDKKRVDKLNSILHPIILDKMNDELATIRKSKVKIAFIDAPLLFEVGLDKICNQTWLLVCGIDEQIRRVMERDNRTYEQAADIIDKQLPDTIKKQRATKTIDTSANIEVTIRYIKTLLEETLDELN